MRKRLMIAILLILLCTSPAYAQGAVALKSFNVQLWAEHDQPSMLVIYTFEVSDDTQIPTSIDIRIPRDGNITAVAFEDSNNGPLLADYTNKTVEDANWQVITIFLTERTTYRVEYYQPLGRNGDKRSFTFQWITDNPIESFDVEVQVPNDSTGVKTTPAIPLVQEQIFLSGGAMLNAMNEGDDYQLRLEYSRTSDEPSVAPPSGQLVEPLVPIDANTDGRVTLENLPLVLGGFGAVLIATALFYFLRNGSSSKQRKPRQRHATSQNTTSQIHCHECGTRAHEGDRFCRICGSRLRV